MVKTGAALIMGMSLLATLSSQASAQATGLLELAPGTAEVVRTTRGARIVVIGNPEVATASVASDEAIVLTGKVAGTTNLIAIDEEGAEILRREIRVSTPPVLPTRSTEGPHVKVRSIGGRTRGGGELVRNYVCPAYALCVLTNSRNEAPPITQIEMSGLPAVATPQVGSATEGTTTPSPPAPESASRSAPRLP